MKLLCWNIKHGGGKRVGQIAVNIERHQPDLVILCEFRHNSAGLHLRQFLKGMGLNHQRSSSTAEAPKRNGLLVASRFPMDDLNIPGDLTGNEHRMLGVRVKGMNLVAFYFPNKEAKHPVFDFILGLPQQYLSEPTLLIGDFNTGLHRIDENDATFYSSDQFKSMLSQGWIDSWRHFHGMLREFTWYSSVGNGFRLDHAFVSPSLLETVQHVKYSHEEREERISDHSMVIMDLH